ncbi:MAG TPA: hypothetical protein VKZ49_18815 [Polyangiaceae bacterium]|nr:hypothetical protein [Polyangiaceae bacterium]
MSRPAWILLGIAGAALTACPSKVEPRQDSAAPAAPSARPGSVSSARPQDHHQQRPLIARFIEYARAASDPRRRGVAEKPYCERQICSASYRPPDLYGVQVRAPQADPRALVAGKSFAGELACADFGRHRVVHSDSSAVQRRTHCELTDGGAAGMHLLLTVYLQSGEGSRTFADLFSPEYLKHDPEFAECIKQGTVACGF